MDYNINITEEELESLGVITPEAKRIFKETIKKIDEEVINEQPSTNEKKSRSEMGRSCNLC
jgi:hypothetical protein